MGLLNNFKKKILVGICLTAGFFLNIIAIILPWRQRIAYLNILELGARIILRYTFVMDFMKDRAFAQKSEKELFLKKN